MMDRIDIHIDVPAMTYEKLYAKIPNSVSSAEIRANVLKARNIQKTRFGSHGVVNNATMSHREVERFCGLDAAGQGLLKHAMSEFGLSARAHDKICKVSRTIADLEPSETIKTEHIAEAIGYRRLDRKL